MLLWAIRPPEAPPGVAAWSGFPPIIARIAACIAADYVSEPDALARMNPIALSLSKTMRIKPRAPIRSKYLQSKFNGPQTTPRNLRTCRDSRCPQELRKVEVWAQDSESNYLFCCEQNSHMFTIDPSSTELQRKKGESTKNLRTEDEKWNAVLARDGKFDGAFVFAVRSTGIYCKPSCAARRPRREQVVFFAGPDVAELSGFRPCLRCRPRDVGPSPKTELIARVCKYIESNLDRKLSLSNLSAQAGISPYHLQRTFKRIVGISPREYVKARRLSKMKSSLRNGQTVAKALYGAGFSSRSRIYEKAPTQFGVNPGTLRRGGLGLRIEYAIVDCPLGRLLVGTTERGICAVCMGDSDAVVEAALTNDYPSADIHRNDEAMRGWVGALTKYFSSEEFDLNLPLDVRATAFQWKVWKEIQSVPYGKTTTYSKIANALGEPDSARAVARACATNPVSLVIPCHRVIGEDGELHGYRWGKKRKHALLALEQRAHREAVKVV